MNPPRLIPFEARQPRNDAAPSPLSVRGLTVAGTWITMRPIAT